MPNLSQSQFPPPNSWDDFEDICADVFSKEWSCPSLTRYARQGQSQNGVDIYGNVSEKHYGLQCKQKGIWPPKELTTEEMDEEVAKALNFRPKLDVYCFATTAPHDAPIQDHARELTEAHRKLGLFSVEVYPWKEIDRRIKSDKDISLKHYGYAEGSIAQADIKEILDGVRHIQQTIIEGVEKTRLLQSICHTISRLFNRNFVVEPVLMLDQLKPLLALDTDTSLNKEVVSLEAQKLRRTEKVKEAKNFCLAQIAIDQNNIDLLAIYVELCAQAPATGDRLNEVLLQFETLAPQDERLVLHKLSTQLDDALLEDKATENLSLIKSHLNTNDNFISGRFCALGTLYAHHIDRSDLISSLILEWKKRVPSSSRPILFELMFAAETFLKKAPSKEEIKSFKASYENKKNELNGKDPLPKRDSLKLCLLDIQTFILELREIGGDEGKIEHLTKDFLKLASECYFDKAIDAYFHQLLSLVKVEDQELFLIKDIIEQSETEPSQALCEFIFLQSLRCLNWENWKVFFKKYNMHSLIDLRTKFDTNNAEQISAAISKYDPIFVDRFVVSIGDAELKIKVISLLSTQDRADEYLDFHKLVALEELERFPEALALIENYPQSKITFVYLGVVERIASKTGRHDLTINAGTKLLDMEGTPATLKKYIQARVAIAYFQVGDDAKAINFAELALSNTCCNWTDQQIRPLLEIVVQAHTHMGNSELARESLKKYSDVERDFRLSVIEIETLLASTNPDDFQLALTRLLTLCNEVRNFGDKEYAALHEFFLILANRGLIDSASKNIVTDGVFVKISKMERWFYLGAQNEGLDAICLEAQDSRHSAVFSKKLGDSIHWPADEYRSPKLFRTIEKIFSKETYLFSRCAEALQRLIESGEGGGRIVEVPEEGRDFLKVLKNVIEAQEQDSRSFFDLYCASPIPFSCLSFTEGGIHKAISRISSEQKGFIHCNNGTVSNIEAHALAAKKALNGAPLIIDGLPALVLAEFGILELVISRVSWAKVSTSVISMLRDTASAFLPNPDVAGKVSVSQGKVRFFENKPGSQETLRQKLLYAAEKLDKLPGKFIGKSRFKKSLPEWNGKIPSYVRDTYLAGTEDANSVILTDDKYYFDALALCGVPVPVSTCSSISFVRELCEAEIIDRDLYAEFFGFLSSYRFRLLPISVDDLLNAVIKKSKLGIVHSINPKAIRNFNLPLTLSSDYGVSEQVAMRILALFCRQVIIDASIGTRMASEIFCHLIAEGFGGRDRRFCWIFLKLCRQYVQKVPLIQEMVEEKFQLLTGCLNNYFSEYNPVVRELPLTIRADVVE